MTERLFPHPLMSLVLVAVWLLLVGSLSAGHVLLAVALGWFIPFVTRPFWPERPRLARPRLIARFARRVLIDIVRSNLAVARTVMTPRPRIKPAFVEYPVELQSELAITVLASVIALTPGTVAAALSADRRTILIHALDVPDPGALVADLKTRYEILLREILPC